MNEGLTPISDEEFDVGNIEKSFPKNPFIKEAYSTSEVVDITRITRQPLRSIQDPEDGIIKPQTDGNNSKKLFSIDEVVLILLARIANDLGYTYKKGNNDEKNEKNVKGLFSELNNSPKDIATFLRDKYAKYVQRKSNDLGFLVYLAAGKSPEMSFFLAEKVMDDDTDILEEKEDSPDIDYDEFLKINDFYSFINALPDMSSVLKTPENIVAILSKLEELVKNEFPEKDLNTSMEYIMTLDENPSHDNYILIADMGGFSNHNKLCSWIGNWKLRYISNEMSKGLYKETIYDFINEVKDILGEELFVAFRLDSEFIYNSYEIYPDKFKMLYGEDTFENIKKLANYDSKVSSEISILISKFMDKSSELIFNGEDISISTVRQIGSNMYDLLEPYFQSSLSSQVRKCFSGYLFEKLKPMMLETVHEQFKDICEIKTVEPIINQFSISIFELARKFGNVFAEENLERRTFISEYFLWIDDLMTCYKEYESMMNEAAEKLLSER